MKDSPPLFATEKLRQNIQAINDSQSTSQQQKLEHSRYLVSTKPCSQLFVSQERPRGGGPHQGFGEQFGCYYTHCSWSSVQAEALCSLLAALGVPRPWICSITNNSLLLMSLLLYKHFYRAHHTGLKSALCLRSTFHFRSHAA